MLSMEVKTGLSRTVMSVVRSALTCELFLRSSVAATFACTAFRRSRAARVSCEMGILIPAADRT